MSTYLRRMAPDLALNVAVGTFACYGLHKIFPTPHQAQLLVIVAIHGCACSIIQDIAKRSAYLLSIQNDCFDANNRLTNQKFYSLCNAFSSFTILLPVFYKFVGQRMGYQVPDYMVTIAYLTLTLRAFYLTKHCFDFIAASCYSKPAR